MHNFVFTFFIILTLGVLTVVDARGGRHGHGKVSSMTPTPTPTAEDITKSTGSSEAVSPTSGSETAQEEGVITESPAHENVEDRGNINSILSAFADKMIHLMKENSLPAGIPESIGVPVEARNSTSQKLKVDMSQLPFAPGVEDIGRGFDTRFNRPTQRLVYFSKLDAVQVQDNPEYITPRKIQFMMRDRLGATENSVQIYRNGRDFGENKCKGASYFGLAPCILDPKVFDVERIVKGHTMYAEESRTFESHMVQMQGSFAAQDKVRSHILEEHGCYVLNRDPEDPSKNKYSCRDQKLPEEMTSSSGFTYAECCKNNALYAKGGQGTEVDNEAFCYQVPFMRKICAYVNRIVNIGQSDNKLEGSKSSLDADFIKDVLSLPDCVLDARQVINDEDFKDTGPGVFSDEATYLSEEEQKIVPQCNSADMRIYASFFMNYGTDIMASAVFGGRITTSYEISTSEATKLPGSLYDNVKKIINHYSRRHELMESPTHTIMTRDAHDNLNMDHEGIAENKLDSTTIGLESGNIFGSFGGMSDSSFLELGENPMVDSSKEQETSSTHRSGRNHQNYRGVSINDLLLRVSTSVEGGHALPVSGMGSGSFTRDEMNSWVRSLRHQGSAIRFNTVGLYELLKHPQMIRAFFLYCGPYGGSSISEDWEREKFMTWQALWYADIFEPRQHWSIPKWKDLTSTNCGKLLRRKYQTMINAQEYLRVKADAFYDRKKEQIQLETDVIKLKNLLLVSYQKWEESMLHVIATNNRTTSSTPQALWKSIESYVEQTGISKKIVEPVTEYLTSAKAYRVKCSRMCSNLKDLTTRTIDIYRASSGLTSLQKTIAGSTDPDNGKLKAVQKLLGKSSTSGEMKKESSRFKSQRSRLLKSRMKSYATDEGDRTEKNAPIATKAKTSGSESGAESGQSKFGDAIVSLAKITPQEAAIADKEATQCSRACVEDRDDILKNTAETNNAQALAIRDLFVSVESSGFRYCEGMVQMEMTQAYSLKEGDLDNDNRISPADKYCGSIDSDISKEMCYGFKNLLTQFMQRMMGSDSDAILSEHRFIFFMRRLLQNNPSYSWMRMPQLFGDRPYRIPPEVVPENLRKEKMLGGISKKDQRKYKKENELREMGTISGAESAGSSDELRSQWDPKEFSVRFCSQLLPVNRPKGVSRNQIFLLHSKNDPSARLEKARNEWIGLRSKIEELHKEIEEVEDKETRNSKKANVEQLSHELWCSGYKQKLALVALELQAAEQNYEIATCWMCSRLSEGYTIKDTCEFFPEKKVDLSKGSSSRFTSLESTVQHEKNKNKMRFRSNKKIETEAAVEGGGINLLDNFGFGPQEKMLCMGSVVVPKDLNKDVYQRMQQALMGPQMLKSACEISSKLMMKAVDSKRDILAQVVGTYMMDNDKCDPEEKDEEKKADCNSKMFRQFARLRNQVFTADGLVKDEWKQAGGALARYGSSGGTICQDINWCASEDAEDYVWRWSRSNRKSELKSKVMKKKLPDGLKKRPPAFHDAEKFKAIAKAFEFPHADNPLWSQLKVQPYFSGSSS